MINRNAENNQEFNNIYELFHEKIQRYLSRMVSETDVDDLAQEVFIKVSRGLKDFKGQSSLSTWIYKIATNTALDRLRALSKQKESDRFGQDDSDNAVDIYMLAEDHKPLPEASLIKKEMNNCIRDIVEGMQEKHRTVLILSEFEELCISEISGILNISADAVKIRLHRARTKLRNELKKKCNLYRDERNELACEPSPIFLISPEK